MEKDDIYNKAISDCLEAMKKASIHSNGQGDWEEGFNAGWEDCSHDLNEAVEKLRKV